MWGWICGLKVGLIGRIGLIGLMGPISLIWRTRLVFYSSKRSLRTLARR